MYLNQAQEQESHKREGKTRPETSFPSVDEQECVCKQNKLNFHAEIDNVVVLEGHGKQKRVVNLSDSCPHIYNLLLDVRDQRSLFILRYQHWVSLLSFRNWCLHNSLSSSVRCWADLFPSGLPSVTQCSTKTEVYVHFQNTFVGFWLLDARGDPSLSAPFRSNPQSSQDLSRRIEISSNHSSAFV